MHHAGQTAAPAAATSRACASIPALCRPGGGGGARRRAGSGQHQRIELHHRRSRRAPLARSSNDDELQEIKLGPNVTAGIREVKEGLAWSPATVTRNE
jgi:hypothetical protein